MLLWSQKASQNPEVIKSSLLSAIHFTRIRGPADIQFSFLQSAAKLDYSLIEDLPGYTNQTKGVLVNKEREFNNFQILRQDFSYSRRRNFALGSCPRIEAAARESGFASIFSIIMRRILAVLNEFNRKNGPKSAFPQ